MTFEHVGFGYGDGSRRIFDDLNLLVLEGDASALAKHVFDLSGSRVTLPSGDDDRVTRVES